MTESTSRSRGRRAEPVTKTPGCHFCPGPADSPICYTDPTPGAPKGRYLPSCKAHETQAYEHWRQRFPDHVARLEASLARIGVRLAPEGPR